MSFSCAFYPAYIITGLDPGTPVKVFDTQVLSYDIGPAEGPTPGEVTTIDKPADVIVNVVPLSGSIGVYNGISGNNPRGFNVQVTITYTGITRSAGNVVIHFCPVQDYGSPTLVINLDGSVGAVSAYILDTFHDVDGVDLAHHIPDASPAGGLSGWQGTGAFSGEIQGNLFVIGGNSGTYKFARIYAALSSCMVFADVYRSTDPGGSGEAMVLIGRANAVSGNDDTGQDYIAFNATKQDNSLVNLSLSQVVGGIITHNESNFATFAWARLSRKRMFMRMRGSQVLLYIGDEGGLDNIQLVHTATLATPADDSSHKYTGLAYLHLNQNQNFSTFGTLLVNLLIDELTGLTFDNNIIPIPSQDVNLTAEPQHFPIGSLSTAIHYVVGSGWLSVSLDQTTTPAVMTVSVDPTGLVFGTYTANIEVISDADNSPLMVPVTFTVGLYTDAPPPFDPTFTAPASPEVPTFVTPGCEV